MRVIKAAILGSGNIGMDLAIRLLDDRRFQVEALIGRRADSPGLIKGRDLGIPIFSEGLEAALADGLSFDVVFDATSAMDHQDHWKQVEKLGKLMIDLTPSKIGKPMVPVLIDVEKAFTISNTSDPTNYSMVTCGGQSSAGILSAIVRHSRKIKAVEVSSSIASLSAGLATRRNIDNYIAATENLATMIALTPRCKAILVLNPAEPPVMMRTTVTVEAEQVDFEMVENEVLEIEKNMQKYVPGFRTLVPPFEKWKGVVSSTALVEGAGYFLPSYAGNLDVINAAGVETAWQHFLSVYGMPV